MPSSLVCTFVLAIACGQAAASWDQQAANHATWTAIYSASTPEQAAAAAKAWIRNTTLQEMIRLREFLKARQSSFPHGVELLDQMAREIHPRGVPQSLCSSYTTETTCTSTNNQANGWVPCHWSGSSCYTRTCSTSYTDQAACDANVHNIPEGCYWKDGSAAYGSSGCTDQDCNSMASALDYCGTSSTSCTAHESACNGIPGCQISGSDCVHVSTARRLQMTLSACQDTDCVTCLKAQGSTTSSQASAWNSSTCGSRCDKVVHCQSEATCLLDLFLSGSPTSSMRNASSCTKQCQAIEAACAAQQLLCGTTNTTCSSVTGATQTQVSLWATLVAALAIFLVF